MARGAKYWIAVIAVDSAGVPLTNPDAITPVQGITDIADERTPPPDTRAD